ncbi:uncharacterized protein BXZ73DRAFT_77990 [Epithele typhae]|uniref:uncharacterized protein n=1 Tax=Epithele typhae TaxID=378194 RepID=UPI00200735C7|nr:uncharacterized protein BXZ73DRAFT_77990 [Epithele typhae]KAH9929871.1 hypothetical protein BXZ73DRAFT_77990 [Epithele typhae]
MSAVLPRRQRTLMLDDGPVNAGTREHLNSPEDEVVVFAIPEAGVEENSNIESMQQGCLQTGPVSPSPSSSPLTQLSACTCQVYESAIPEIERLTGGRTAKPDLRSGLRRHDVKPVATDPSSAKKEEEADKKISDSPTQAASTSTKAEQIRAGQRVTFAPSPPTDTTPAEPPPPGKMQEGVEATIDWEEQRQAKDIMAGGQTVWYTTYAPTDVQYPPQGIPAMVDELYVHCNSETSRRRYWVMGTDGMWMGPVRAGDKKPSDPTRRLNVHKNGTPSWILNKSWTVSRSRRRNLKIRPNAKHVADTQGKNNPSFTLSDKVQCPQSTRSTTSPLLAKTVDTGLESSGGCGRHYYRFTVLMTSILSVAEGSVAAVLVHLWELRVQSRWWMEKSGKSIRPNGCDASLSVFSGFNGSQAADFGLPSEFEDGQTCPSWRTPSFVIRLNSDAPASHLYMSTNTWRVSLVKATTLHTTLETDYSRWKYTTQAVVRPCAALYALRMTHRNILGPRLEGHMDGDVGWAGGAALALRFGDVWPCERDLDDERAMERIKADKDNRARKKSHSAVSCTLGTKVKTEDFAETGFSSTALLSHDSFLISAHSRVRNSLRTRQYTITSESADSEKWMVPMLAEPHSKLPSALSPKTVRRSLSFSGTEVGQVLRLVPARLSPDGARRAVRHSLNLSGEGPDIKRVPIRALPPLESGFPHERVPMSKVHAPSSLDQSKTPSSQRKPVSCVCFLVVGVPYHSKYLSSVVDEVMDDLDDIELWKNEDLGIPVFHTENGTDLRTTEGSLTGALCDQIFTLPIHWSAATNFPDTATHTVDFGLGCISGIGPLTARNLEGRGVWVIVAGDKAKGPRGALRLLIRQDGALVVEEVLACSCQDQAGFVGAVLDHIESAGGGHYNAAALRSKFQFPLWQEMRREGLPTEGFYVAAGIPSTEKAAEIITTLRESGIKHVSFKPGSVGRLRTPLLPVHRAHDKYTISGGGFGGCSARSSVGAARTISTLHTTLETDYAGGAALALRQSSRASRQARKRDHSASTSRSESDTANG